MGINIHNVTSMKSELINESSRDAAAEPVLVAGSGRCHKQHYTN